MEAFFLFYLILFIGLFYKVTIRRKTFLKKYALGCGLFLIFIFGLRDVTVGRDAIGYARWFDFIGKLEWKEIGNYFYKDFGYWYTNKLLYFLSEDFQFALFVFSSISMFFIIRYIYIYSPDDILTYFIFIGCGYLAIGINIVRQYIAIAITLYALDFIIGRKLKKFLILMCLASSIHISAIFFIPAYFFAYCKMNSQNILRYLFISLLFTFFGYYLIFYITNIFFGGYYQSPGFFEDEGGKLTLIMVIFVLVAGLINLRNILHENEKNIVYYNFLWLALLIQLQSLYIHDVSRVGFYYNFHVVIFIPIIIHSIKNRFIKYGMYGGTIIASLLVYFNKMYNLNDTYPYLFFWQ